MEKMKRIEKLMEGIKPVIPNIKEYDIEQLVTGGREWCTCCMLSDYCEDLTFLKENGEVVTNEEGDAIPRLDTEWMKCSDVVTKWLNEDYE